MHTTDVSELQPTTRTILDTFHDEIVSLGGTIKDSFDSGRLMIARSVLPAVTDVRRSDRIQSGVAIRAFGPLIEVHPYTFRLVCANGAITTHLLQSRRVSRVQALEVFFSPTERVAAVLEDVRDAVRSCASAEAFAASTSEMESAMDTDAHLGLIALQLLARNHRIAAHILDMIERRFASSIDRSGFGLMNAVTSVARDTPDPETRWSLETMGARVLALLLAPVDSDVSESLSGV